MNELLVVTPNGYKTSKLYSVVPANGAGDLTWVRNTTATRVNSSGLIELMSANVPRLDYSGGVTCPCILVEPQRTNRLTYSEEFNNASWSKANITVTANDIASPDGNITADKIQSTANTGTYVFRTISTTIGVSSVTSVFIKKGNTDWVYFGINEPLGGDFGACFNVNTGTIGTATGTGFTSLIEDYSNGWYRCSIIKVSTKTSLLPAIIPISNDNTFNASSGKNCYIWGAQNEVGTSITSYIPTVASTQTRNADVATVTTPVGITSLIETYEDNTTNVVNPIPVTYQMSEGRIAKVVGL